MSKSVHPSLSSFVRNKVEICATAKTSRQLEPPVIDDEIAGFDGLVPVSVLTEPLKITVKPWQNGAPPGLEDTVTLLMASDVPGPIFVEVDRLTVPGPVASVDRKLEVPVERLREGNYLLKTYLHHWADNNAESPLVLLKIDRTPPYGNNDPIPLILPTFPLDVITDAEVDSVEVEIPAYSQQRGDRVAFFWGELPDDPVDVVPIEVIDVPDDRKYTYPKLFIEAVGDGVMRAAYGLIDKAGNPSRMSGYSTVEVALGPYPEDLQVPEIPLAVADNLINLEDASAVTIEIPQFSGYKEKDVIKGKWGTRELEPYTISANPAFPLVIRVAFETLKAEYGSASGEVATTISYQVARGRKLLFPDTPMQATVNVDLSVAGPVNPEEPDPVNPVLDVVVVTGASGGPVNTLGPDDNGLSATATFKLYTPALLGERIELFYGNDPEPVDTYVVTGSEDPDFEVGLTIPWTKIDAHGNDSKVPVYYRIYTLGSSNHQYSRLTEVNVSAVVITLPKPEFLHLSSNGFINCDSLQAAEGEVGLGVDVKVPGNPRYFEAGMEVTFEWWGVVFGDSETEIPTTRFSHVHELTASEVTDGFTVRVHPYDPHIFNFYTETESGYGNAMAQYSVEINENPVPSTLAEPTLVVLGGPGGSCVIP